MAHILIVDDNTPVAEVFGEIIAGIGHASDRAATAIGSIERIINNQYDIVLLDIALEEETGDHRLNGNGIVAGMAMRWAGYRGAIVIVTGGLLEIDPRFESLIGVSSIVRKPAAPREIAAVIERCLGGSSNGDPA